VGGWESVLELPAVRDFGEKQRKFREETSSTKMYYLFLCYSYISYILALEGSVGGLLKTFTATPAPLPQTIFDSCGKGSL
jgi:hypothetical protein